LGLARPANRGLLTRFAGFHGKIADFGLTLHVGHDHGARKFCDRWASPELIESGNGDQASDVWAWGVTAVELFGNGRVPFYRVQDSDEVITAIRNQQTRILLFEQILESCRPLWYRVISPCLEHEPAKRPTFALLLEDLDGEIRRTSKSAPGSQSVQAVQATSSGYRGSMPPPAGVSDGAPPTDALHGGYRDKVPQQTTPLANSAEHTASYLDSPSAARLLSSTGNSAALKGDYISSDAGAFDKHDVLEGLDFSRDVTLGSGSFGSVVSARWEHGGCDVAVKFVEREVLETLEREVRTLRTLRHPHIVQFLGVCEFDGKRGLVMEVVRGRDALLFLQNRARESTAVNLRSRLWIARDTAAGCLFLANSDLVHGDLALRNVLISDSSAPDATPSDERYAAVSKVTDFGLSTGQQEESETKRTAVRWTAPEILQDRKSGRSPSSDIWSYCCLLNELLTQGDPPFASLPTDVVLAAAREGTLRERAAEDIPRGCPADIKNLLLSGFDNVAARRPTFEHVLRVVDDTLLLQLDDELTPAPGLPLADESGTDDGASYDDELSPR
jgi:serine/threonine protein kinase